MMMTMMMMSIIGSEKFEVFPCIFPPAAVTQVCICGVPQG